MSKFALLFITVYLGGLGASIFVDAIWGFYLYQIVYFLYPDHRWWGASLPGIGYSFIVVFTLLAMFAARYSKYKENRLFDVPQTKWLILIFLLFSALTPFAADSLYHKKALYEVFKLFLVMGIAYKIIDTPKKLDGALWSYLLGAAYIGVEAVRVGRDMQGRVEGIGTATTGDSNGVCAMLISSVPMIIFYLWKGNIYTKVAAVIVGAVIVNGIVLINSRGAFLGVVAGGGYFMLAMIRNRFGEKGQKFKAIAIILAGLFGGLYLTDDAFWSRMNTLQEVEDESKSGSHRVHMWMATFDLVHDYPFGAGAGGFQALSPEYVPPEFFFRGQKRKAVHSTWFQALAELGWLGPFLFVSLLLSCLRLTKRTRNYLETNGDSQGYYKVVALEGALIGYIICGTFIDELRSEIYYWMIMFTACAGNIYYLKRKA